MRSRLELGRGRTPATRPSLAWSAAHGVCHHRGQSSRTRRGMLDHSLCDRRTQGASLRAFTPVFDGLWTRVNALKARWKAPRAITILMAWNSQLEDPHVQAKGRAMALDDKTQTELEAAAFRRLVEHLRKRSDVQNIDLMNLAGFCRNCLANWYQDAAAEHGIALDKPEAREIIYGMPYGEWQALHQKEASAE